MARLPVALLLAAGLLSFTLSSVGAEPPGTPREPVTETLHGDELVDPYRWLEGDATGKLTDEVLGGDAEARPTA